VRLLHLAHYPVRYPGSFVPMLRAALETARARGWDAEAVLGEDSRGCDWVADLERRGIGVRFVELDGRLKLRRDFLSLLAESDAPTVLHTHFTSFDLPAALAGVRRPSTAVVWHLHSAARHDLPGRLRGVFRSSVTGRLADRILCVAPDLAETVLARGAPRDRVRFFPNAIDTSAFPGSSRLERDQARMQLGLDLDAVVLLHFGWNWRIKGGDVFLQAVRALVDRGRPVTAFTIGAGPEAEELARELALGAAFVTRPFGERPQTLYAAADVLASPSRAEGMPFSMLEALASGLPVAASDIPGQAALGRGLGACRLTPLDPLAFADAVESLLDRAPETAAADAAVARRRMREEHDLATWAERLLGVYEELFPATSSS
jgi:glycosyltransferase involved in cell wall biosynthesis